MNLHKYRHSARLMLLVVTALAAGAAAAQNYPVKTVRIVLGSSGGGGDFMVRLVAQGLAASFGQPVIVDNRGIAAAEIVANALPDGYTLLSYGNPLWIAPLFSAQVGWDPFNDFAPLTLAVSAPNLIVVHPSLPVKSVQELIALARARPGELNYASSTNGSSTHIAGELFKSMARVDIVRVPYKGNAQGVNALIGGQVQLMFPNAGAVTPHVKSGRLRAIAVTSAAPSALAPGLPTAASSGLPGYESTSYFAMFAPAKLPAALVQRLNREIVQILQRTEVREKLFDTGMEVVGSSPQELTAAMKAEIAALAKR